MAVRGRVYRRINGRVCGSPQVYEDGGFRVEISNTDAHSFIIRIWLEETVEEAGRASWRGHITHVQSGRRRYFVDLGVIDSFVKTYLEDMGVKFGFGARLSNLLTRLRR